MSLCETEKNIIKTPFFIKNMPPGEKQTKEQDVCGGGESETEA